MAKLITNSGKTLPRIQQTGKTFEKINPKKVAEALGAVIVPNPPVEVRGPIPRMPSRQSVLRQTR